MKKSFLMILMLSISCGLWAEPIKPCLPTAPTVPTVLNEPIWMVPNRDNPNWQMVPTISSPPRTSSSVPSRGG